MSTLTTWIEEYAGGGIDRATLIERLQSFPFATPARYDEIPDDPFEADAQAEERDYDEDATVDEIVRARDVGLLTSEDFLAIVRALS